MMSVLFFALHFLALFGGLFALAVAASGALGLLEAEEEIR